MRAIVYDTTGPSSVLHLVDRALPEPGDGEVRVRVAVSGVNPTDWKSRSGSEQLPAPKVPNQDGAGVVDAVGPGVEALAVGQRVWLWDAAYQRLDGTAQEFVVLPEAQAVPLPESESFDTGASLGIPALTAHRALTAGVDSPEQLVPGALAGTTVLVAGGAGAVGHAAIQLAVWAGATVITTISNDRKGDLARAAGAQHVLNYRSEDVAARVREIAPDGVDTVVEVNPVANAELDVNVAALGATVAIYATDTTDPLVIPVNQSMGKNVRFQFLLTYTTSAAQKAAAVASVSAALAEGALRVGEEYGMPVVRFPLAETAHAHDAVQGGVVGKVLIDVA